MMHYTLFHLTDSRSQRIVWLLEELDIDYELKIYHEHLSENQEDPIKQFNPSAKFPTLLLTDSQQASVVLTESAAIAEYFSQRMHQLGTEQLTPEEQIDFFFWKNFADASFMPNLALKQIFKQLVQRTPFPFRIFTRLLKRGFDHGFLNQALEQQLTLINNQLEHHEWISGSQFTIADILLWFPLKACFELDGRFQHYSEIRKYLNRIENREAFQRAIVKGEWSTPTFEHYWSNAY